MRSAETGWFPARDIRHFVFEERRDELKLNERYKAEVRKKNTLRKTKQCCILTYFGFKREHITRQEVRAKIQQAIGSNEDLAIIKRRQLKWYRHVSPLPSC